MDLELYAGAVHTGRVDFLALGSPHAHPGTESWEARCILRVGEVLSYVTCTLMVNIYPACDKLFSPVSSVLTVLSTALHDI